MIILTDTWGVKQLFEDWGITQKLDSFTASMARSCNQGLVNLDLHLHDVFIDSSISDTFGMSTTDGRQHQSWT
jgi:hypothetical protein